MQWCVVKMGMQKEAVYLILFGVLLACFVAYAWTRPDDIIYELLIEQAEKPLAPEDMVWGI